MLVIIGAKCKTRRKQTPRWAQSKDNCLFVCTDASGQKWNEISKAGSRFIQAGSVGREIGNGLSGWGFGFRARLITKQIFSNKWLRSDNMFIAE